MIDVLALLLDDEDDTTSNVSTAAMNVANALR
jgi:hypothetical protein